jgi:hypothetical protein
MFHIYEVSSLEAPVALVSFAKHQEALAFFRGAVGSLGNLSGNPARFMTVRERCLSHGVHPTRILSANDAVYAVGYAKRSA